MRCSYVDFALRWLPIHPQIDAIGTKRFDSQTGADREVQRILLELLNQMDGFDQSTNVKVIMATNRMDTLDPALMRPGRLDRKVRVTTWAPHSIRFPQGPCPPAVLLIPGACIRSQSPTPSFATDRY